MAQVYGRRPSQHLHSPTSNQHTLLSYQDWRQRVADQSNKPASTLRNLGLQYNPEFITQQHAQASRQAASYWSLLLQNYSPSRFDPLPAGPARSATDLQEYSFDIQDAQLFHKSCVSTGFNATTIVQSAWALTLGTHMSTRDVCFAYKPPSRDVPLVGPFLRTLYRRIAMDDREPSKRFLRKVHSSYLDAVSNQGCTQVDIERSLNRKVNSFCNTLLSVKFSSNTPGPFTAPPVSKDAMSEYDITVYLDLSKNAVSIKMWYHPARFSNAAIEALASSFSTALFGLTVSPMTPLGSISLTDKTPETYPVQPISAQPSDRFVSAKPFSLCDLRLPELAHACGLDEDRIEDAYPCTPLQQGLMTITTRQPDAFTARETFRLSSRLDSNRLRQVIDAIAVDFPILRTRLVQVSSENTLQVVVRDAIAWEHSTSLDRYLEKDLAKPMGYGLPVWRFALVNDAASGASYLCWTCHHCGYDGWSENHLLATIRTAYQTSTFERPRPFADFIRYFLETDCAESQEYWATQLSGEKPTPFPTLPLGVYDPHVDQRIVLRTKFLVPDHSTVLPSSFLRAAWALTASQYSDSDDIIFASTLSGRQAPLDGIDVVPGPTITTVPIRMTIDKGQSIADYLAHTHDAALEMIPHEHYGLQNITRISNQVRQAMELNSYFLVQPSNPEGENPDAKALGLNRVPGAGEDFSADAYPLNVQCHLDGDHVIIDATFDSRIFSKQQMDLLIGQFAHTIHSLANCPPTSQLQEMSMVSDTEYAKLLELNHDYPETYATCIHTLIEERVRESPNTEAVCSFDGNMTYEKLNVEATRLAAHLVDLGVGPEVPVALCMEKGRLVIVSMLAVLKAGGVCVCFAASQPQKRLETLIADLETRIVLAAPQHLHLFDGLVQHLLPVSDDFLEILPCPEDGWVPCNSVRPSNAAFIVYTSGSTGQPKGIVLEHQSICTSSRAHGSAMGIERGQRVLQFSSFLYDVYIQDIFTSLQRGATVCVVSEEERYNNLTAAINRSGATWADLTSTVADLLDPNKVPTLKTISLGGEPMKPEVAAKWEPRDGMQVINVYGPAECSVTATCSTISQRRGNPSNIGPACGCWCWVVDPSNRNLLKPIGAVGELLIEGPILSRHYLNDPEKTEAAFLHDLTWMRSYESHLNTGAPQSRRVYATGDLVRLQHDGTIVYVGRADKQVKINGQRVELGEIESNLAIAASTPTKVACEMVSTKAMQGRKVLTAFLASKDYSGRSPIENTSILALSEELKSLLSLINKKAKNTLPSHMIPGLYIPLQALPKSPSGKLDRKALKALLDPLPSDAVARYAITHATVKAPETPRQYQLRDIWCAVLRIPQTQVGADSNLFGVGGDSVAAMQLVSRASAQGLSLSVAQIFQHPTLRDMASIMEEVALSEKRDFGQFDLCPQTHLQSIIKDAESQCRLTRDQFEDIFPSTRLQEGLLALTAVDADAYVNRMVFKLPESIDMKRFQNAWQAVIQTHSILRTRMVVSSALERYMQVIIKGHIKWRIGESVSKYIESDESDPFEAGAPLSRFALISQQEDQYFVWTIHHAAYDGWSVKLIFEELENAYNGSALSHVGDFRPFVSFLEAQNPSEQEQYWKAALGSEGSTSWPQSQVSDSTKSTQNTVRRLIAGSECQREGVRQSLLFRGAWALTTAQYAASNDVVMAVTLSGRDMPVDHATELTAPLLTTVPLRVNFSLTQTVNDYFNQLQAQATEMIRFQHFGLQNIIGMQKKRGTPLNLQQLFLIQPEDESEGSRGALGLEQVEAESGNFETYPLNVEVILKGKETVIEAVHDVGVLSPWMMNRIMDQYVHMIHLLAQADESALLGEMNVISQKDSDWIHDLNKSVPSRLPECVHERVERHVAGQPDAQAISSYDRDWTYAELDDAAGLLANELRTLGVGPGAMVPLCFDKSSWAIVAMFATLKAGGACTSISPAYPKERIALIVEDTKAKVALASPHHVHILGGMGPPGQNTAVLGVDQSLIDACTGVDAPQSSKPTQNDPAFVVYTSGSTGRPKGVIVEHGAMASSAEAHGPPFGFGKGSRAAQFASYTFDVSIQDIFTSLQLGGTVCVISEEERMSDLAGAINRRGANWMEMTPTVALLLSPDEVPGIKTLSLGGEILTEQALSKWLRSDIRLLNTYGPTECSINSTWAVVDTPQFNVANIGHPVGCVLWVVAAEDHHQLVPVGCVGEMLIEGPILAREYMNDPEKTAAAFIDNVAWLPGDARSRSRRMYKTGDLVRYQADGGIEYLGRKDQQVKINGLRIELGEIENQAQAGCENVQNAAVDVVKLNARNGAKTLAVFVQFSSKPTTSPSKLLKLDEVLLKDFETIRAHLENALPSYMVPALFFPVSQLPMSASGKLDRKTMRSMAQELTEMDLVKYGLASAKLTDNSDSSNTVAQDLSGLSSNDAAQKIVEIAARVLKIPPTKVNLGLSFVSSGGDSISAMMFTSHCRAAGLAVTVANLLKSKSLADVVNSISKQERSTTSHKHVSDQPTDLSPIQKVYFEQLYSPDGDAADYHYNQSWFGKFTKRIDSAAVIDALHAIVKVHPMFRARFSRAGDVWKQRIIESSPNVCTFSSSTAESMDQMCAFINQRHNHGIDFQKGPVFVGDLFELPNGDQYICMVAHHLVIDIVSWDIVLEDLQKFLSAGATSLEEEPMPFPVWAQLQIEKGESKDLEPAKTGADFQNFTDPAFWSVDHTTVLKCGNSRSRTITVDLQTSNKLLGAANTALSTDTTDLLLSAVAHAFLKNFPGREGLTIFSENHGREPWAADIDLTRTVGWFTTISPVNVRRTDGDDYLSVVRQVKDHRKSLLQNGWAYFTSRYLNPKGVEIANGDSSLMEIEFNWHGQSQRADTEETMIEEVVLDVVSDQGKDVPAQALFDIGVLVQDTGELEMLFEYPENISRQNDIQDWIASIEASLYGLAEALTTSKPAWTLADLALLDTDYAGLDKLQQRIIPSLGHVAQDNVEDVYPCTPMQDGILLSQIREPGSYETEHTFEVSCGDQSPLDACVFANAWQALISRHSSLRTIFIEAVGNVAAYDQVVLKSFEGEVLYCESDSLENAALELKKWPAVDYRQLKPPHRLTICTVPGGKLLCRVEASHTITDGFSGDILERDLNQAYWTGNLPSIGPVYHHFVERVYQVPAAEKIAYWKDYLGTIEPTIFPCLAPPGDLKQTPAANKIITLSDELSATARAFCTQQGITVATLIQVAWASVLNLYTGSESVCFGYLVSGRDAQVSHIQESIGAFMNMMVCRVDFGQKTSSRDVLKSTYERSLQSLEHQHVALADIQHELGQSNESLFNTIMSFQNAGGGAAERHEKELVFEESSSQDPTEYAIALDVGADEESIEISLDYSRSCLTMDQAARVLSCFEQAVINFTASAPSPVADLSPISHQELSSFAKWNGPLPGTVQMCVHTQFTHQAEERPKTPAIVSFDVDLTYSQLDMLSNKLASHLQTLGVGPGTMIPVCFPKTSWTAVAQLAVLKAGGACVSLNPDHPLQRLKGIIEDTGSSTILVAPQSQNVFTGLPYTLVEVDERLLNRLPQAGPIESNVRPSDPAFVVFTSGSTGKPKGVVLSHSALATSAQAHGSAMGINPDTRVLAYAADTYDVSIQDRWTTLQRGGTICVVSEEERLSIDKLTSAIVKRQANWADLTPTVAGLIRPEKVPCLTTVSLGGEAVPNDVVAMWERAGRRVINGYGPAEASINSACSDTDQRHGDAANIGTPLASWFWVTRPGNPNQLVPLGTVGELLIESPQLAEGYLHDHAKTQKAFIFDPSWIKDVPSDGSPHIRRMYRTGDMVKMTEEGTYIFIGRADRQVKIRGQRVELGDIEHQVKAAAPLNSAVAIDVVKSVGHKDRTAVVAYFDFAAQFGPQQQSEDLLLPSDASIENQLIRTRDAVAKTLPAHMLPSFFVPLCRFPVSASGKLELKQLRSLMHEVSGAEIKRLTLSNKTKQAPRSREEAILHGLFCKVLSLTPEEVGIEDNFLALGGDSIVAMHLIRESRKESLHLSVPDVLRNPKIVDLASMVSVAQGQSLFGSEKDYEPFSLLDTAGMTTEEYIQKRVLPVCREAEKGNVADVHPVTAFQGWTAGANFAATRDLLVYFTWTGDGNVNVARLRKSLLATIAKFDTLRSVFIEVGGQVMQVVLKERLDVDIQLHFTEDQLDPVMERLQDADMGHPPRFGEPLAQCAVIQHASESAGSQFTVVLRMTHSQYDGVSMHMMVDFFEKTYNNKRSFVHDEELLSQAHYVEQTVHGDARHRAEEYWRGLLKGSEMTQIAEHDRYPEERSEETKEVYLIEKLPASRSREFTFTEVLRASWARVLSSVSSQADVVLVTLSNGRNMWEPAERVAGCCIHRVPIRVDVSKHPKTTDLVRALKEQAAASLPYETLDMAEIVPRCTDWAPGTKGTSLAIHTNTNDSPEEAIELDGIKMRQRVFERSGKSDTVTVETELQGDEIEISLFWLEDKISARFGRELMDMLCANIREVYEAELAG